MTIDQTQLAAILIATAALVTAIGTAVGNILAQWRTGKKMDSASTAVTAAATEISQKVDTATTAATTAATAATTAATKSDDIHHLVDGNASRSAEQIKELSDRVEMMHQQLMDVMEKRVEDAKAAPPTNPQRPMPVVLVDQRKEGPPTPPEAKP